MEKLIIDAKGYLGTLSDDYKDEMYASPRNNAQLVLEGFIAYVANTEHDQIVSINKQITEKNKELNDLILDLQAVQDTLAL